eukprot:3157097-Pleurochrysis_carterae.AAC.1
MLSNRNVPYWSEESDTHTSSCQKETEKIRPSPSKYYAGLREKSTKKTESEEPERCRSEAIMQQLSDSRRGFLSWYIGHTKVYVNDVLVKNVVAQLLLLPRETSNQS